MKLLRTIRHEDIGIGIASANMDYKERRAARAVLKDSQGRIALLHAAERNYFKLPGGGVEEGEDMALALARELLEEVGAVATVTGQIGRVEEWRAGSEGGLHQISDSYTADVSSPITQPDFTESELAEGFSVVWADDIDDAIHKVARESDHIDPVVRFMALRDETILRAAKEQ